MIYLENADDLPILSRGTLMNIKKMLPIRNLFLSLLEQKSIILA